MKIENINITNGHQPFFASIGNGYVSRLIYLVSVTKHVVDYILDVGI